MADDDKKTEIDMDNLSDEDFMKLDEPEVVEETTETKEEKSDADATSDADKAAADLAAKTAGGGDGSEGAGADDGKSGQEGGGTEGEGGGEEGGGETEAGGDLTDEEKAAAEAKAKAAAEAEETKKVNDDKETLKLKEPVDPDKERKEETPEEKTAKAETENQALVKAQENATSFFEKVSAPFKADGKEIQIRTPEEAIRLMQMGVNYSRRMQEMKPLRETHAMLETHGLNDPEKLNELIDLSKGSKEAIQKYLAKHNIDPLDLDTSKADAHTTPNYRSDPKDVAFQDAIDTTLLAEGGKELLSDVNRDWDDQSKEALRENPSIFGKLLEQRDTGVYSLIQKELLHQKTMGYLANVPFLQAYEQVGNAMEKAGVFKQTSQKTGLAPIDTGSRKSAPKPKTEQTNPNLSSASKSKLAGSRDAAPTEPDYLSMSDEDFMKLAQPS